MADDPTPIERFRRARVDPERAVLEGFHPLKHAVRFGATIELACAPRAEPLAALAARLAPDLGPWLKRNLALVAPPVFRQLAPVPPATGVVAIARRPAVDLARLLTAPAVAPLVLLDNPSRPGNLGAAVRAAAAAGAAGVLTTGRLDPWQAAALRGSAGLHYALPVARLEALPETPRPLLAIDPAGEPLRLGAIPGDAVLAFGAERQGLSAELRARAARCLAIPMRAGVSSLNLASAVAIALYAWRLTTPLPPARADTAAGQGQG
jgi:tRNA G18 (ribose-2'-O)-methylase SpoU